MVARSGADRSDAHLQLHPLRSTFSIRYCSYRVLCSVFNIFGAPLVATTNAFLLGRLVEGKLNPE